MSGYSQVGGQVSAPFYDKMVQDPINWKKKKGSQHEFGCEVERITPGEAEIRYLGNRHRDCKYF